MENKGPLKMFEIKRYTAEDKKEWDDFEEKSKQGTFLFDRNYMDYHHNRFHDYSLMVYRKEKLFALLPANAVGDTLWSHQGLTYGGLLTGDKATAEDILDLFKEMNDYLKQNGFKKVVYKPVPWIFKRQPSEEDLYALINVCHAELCVRNLSATVEMTNPIKWRHDRHYNANKAERNGIVVSQDNGALPEFWKVLDDNLASTYNSKPVHTLPEIQLLAEKFPKNIKLYVARYKNEVVGGVVMYIMPTIVHTQYISASAEGKHLHAVDALIRKIMQDWSGKCRYFDFGTSNEDYGKILNRTLISQKEGFGGRGVCYDWYVWNL